MGCPSILVALALGVWVPPAASAADDEVAADVLLDNTAKPDAKPPVQQAPAPVATVPPEHKEPAGRSPEVHIPDETARACPSGAPIPSSPDEVAQVQRDAEQLASSGEWAQARAVLAAALELHPGDPNLTAEANLIDKEDLHGQAQARVATAAHEIMRIFDVRKPRDTPLVRLISEEALDAPSGADFQAASILSIGSSRQMRPASAARQAGIPDSALGHPGGLATGSPPTSITQIRELDQVGDHSAALALIDKQLAITPGDRALLTVRASQLAKARRFAEAERQARSLVASEDSALLRSIISQSLTAQGHPAEALVQAHRAVAIDPRDANARLAAAEAYLSLGQDKPGLNALYTAAQLDSRFQQLFRDELQARTAPLPLDPTRVTALLSVIALLLCGVGWRVRSLLLARREEAGTPDPADGGSRRIALSEPAANLGGQDDAELEMRLKDEQRKIDERYRG